MAALFLAGVSVGCAADKPEAQISFKLTDENSAPLANAPVHIVTLDHVAPGAGFGDSIYKETNVLTDVKGLASITWTSADGQFSYDANKMLGYYEGGGLYLFKSSLADQWQPRNPTIELVLKPIVNPVPMYAREIKTRIAKPEQRYGYDLLAADWVAPQGKGQTADLFFELTGYANNVKDYNSTLTVTFTNPLDGIQSFVPTKGSAFRSPRVAPLDGYQDKLDLRRVRKPEQSSADWIDDTQSETNYFFRIRTVLDENGKIKSALYGKIYGGFKFFGASTNGSFLTIPTYYLNPEANSRNMEFDPKQNLFKNLPPLERVSAP